MTLEKMFKELSIVCVFDEDVAEDTTKSLITSNGVLNERKK